MFHYNQNMSLNNVKYNRFYRNAEYSGFVNGYNAAIYEKCYDLGYELGRKNTEVFKIPDYYKKIHNISENEIKESEENIQENEEDSDSENELPDILKYTPEPEPNNYEEQYYYKPLEDSEEYTDYTKSHEKPLPPPSPIKRLDSEEPFSFFNCNRFPPLPKVVKKATL